MKRVAFVVVLVVTAFVAPSDVVAAPEDDPAVLLELTFPAGKSPKVFTEGWVFGARCTVTFANGKTSDISAKVAWSGTGTFAPAVGALSRPAFKAAGANTITLTARVGGSDVVRSWKVTAVSPKGADEATAYAKVGDVAHCPTDVHGAPCCPHDVRGPIITGSPNVTIDGLPAARKGDSGVHSACCGANTFKIARGDPWVLIDGKPAARIGDKTHHCGGVGKIVGPAERYYAVFDPTNPTLKKKKLVQRENESDEAWAARFEAWLNALTVKDFDFSGEPDASQAWIVAIEGAALEKYPFFERGAKYALRIDGRIEMDEGEEDERLAGTLLLTLRGTYRSVEALKSVDKTITEASLQRAMTISRADGTGTHIDPTGTFELGPISEGWSKESLEGAVELYKAFERLFDCFIANAVYDNPVAPEVNRFRDFRDQVLRRTESGTHLIRLYYEHGPGYARSLRKSPVLRPLVRAGLDGLAAWFWTLDFDDPETCRRLDVLVRCADGIASMLFDEPSRGRLETLVRGRRDR